MENEVFLKDGIMYVIVHGDQTYASAKEIQRRMLLLSAELKANHQLIRVVTDTRDLGKQDSGTRRASFEILKQVKFDRMSILIKSLFIKGISNMIVKAARMSHKVKLFSDEDAALEWLKR